MKANWLHIARGREGANQPILQPRRERRKGLQLPSIARYVIRAYSASFSVLSTFRVTEETLGAPAPPCWTASGSCVLGSTCTRVSWEKKHF